MTCWAVLGVLAGLVSAVDAVPYVRDTLRGRTRPHRATWCIWSALGVTAFFAQLADGAGWSLLMLGVQAVSMTFVFALSVRRGVGRLSPVDVTLVGMAAVGLAGWYVSDRPLVATVCVVVADLAGVLLMLPKTWHDPGSETASSFVLAAVAGALGTAAVGAFDVALMLYPAYFGVANASTAVLIVHRRRALARRAARTPHDGYPDERAVLAGTP